MKPVGLLRKAAAVVAAALLTAGIVIGTASAVSADDLDWGSAETVSSEFDWASAETASSEIDWG